jgi:hypothetical protein
MAAMKARNKFAGGLGTSSLAAEELSCSRPSIRASSFLYSYFYFFFYSY